MLRILAIALIILAGAFQSARSLDTPKQKESAGFEQHAQSNLEQTQKPVTIVPPTSPDQRQKEAAPDSSGRQRKAPKHWNLSDEIALIATGIGFLQFLALIATVAVMRNSAHRQLRAYVTILGGAVRLGIVDGRNGFLLNVELKNSGLTPGYKFATWNRAKICKSDSPPEFIRFGDVTNNGQSIIGPGCNVHLHWNQAFSGDELAEIRGRTKTIFVWGCADYIDAFRKRRYFVFRCAITGPDSNGVWPLSPYKSGYDAN